MDEHPFLSILVPVYNTETYIRRCVESVIKQEFTDWELILVDDGSSDESLSICRKFEEEDPRIHVIHKENGGLVTARKAAMKAARGLYVTYIDSDDWIKEGFFQAFHDIAKRSFADIICSSIAMIRDGRSTLLKNNVLQGEYISAEALNSVKQALLFKDSFGAFGILPSLCGKWFRRDLVYELQMAVDENIVLGEDAAVTFPAIWTSDRIVISSEAFYQYEIRKGSITNTNSKEKYLRIQRLINYMYGFRDTFSEEPIEFERQIARYWLYLLCGAFEAELSISNIKNISMSFKNIVGEMKKVPENIFDEAELKLIGMDMPSRALFDSWKKKHYLPACVMTAFRKIDKKAIQILHR